MTRLIYITPFLLAGCFSDTSALKKSDINPVSTTKIQLNTVKADRELSSTVTIHGSQTISHNRLNLRVVSIEDSRCPTGTTCIWAGQMVVILEVSNEREEKREIKLVHKRKPEVATVFGYDFTLQEIQPHPKKGNVILLDDQIITLHIVKSAQD